MSTMANPKLPSQDRLLCDFNRLYILTLLYQGPVYGYQIITHFKRHLKKTLSPSLIYPFLAQLESNNYLTHTVSVVGEKRRKAYTLTPEGQTYCHDLFKQFTTLFAPAIKACLTIQPSN